MNQVQSTPTIHRPLKEWSTNEKTCLVSLVALTVIAIAATAIILITHRSNLKQLASSTPLAVSSLSAYALTIGLITFSIIFSRKKQELIEEENIQEPDAPSQKIPDTAAPQPKLDDEVFLTPREANTPRPGTPVNKESLETQKAAFVEELKNVESKAGALELYKSMIAAPAAKSAGNFLRTMVDQVFAFDPKDQPKGLKDKEKYFRAIDEFEKKMVADVVDYFYAEDVERNWLGKIKSVTKKRDLPLQAERLADIKAHIDSLEASGKTQKAARYCSWKEQATNADCLEKCRALLIESIEPTHELFGFLCFIAAKLKFSNWGKTRLGQLEEGLKKGYYVTGIKDQLGGSLVYNYVAADFKDKKLDRYFPFFTKLSNFHSHWLEVIEALYVPFLTLVYPNNPVEAQKKLANDFWGYLVEQGLPTTEEELKPSTAFKTDFFKLMLQVTEKFQRA
jgi:hypothetical protein